MTAPTLTRDAKITDLFVMGNPLDTIAATGASRGAWNRADCLRVVSENGWSLDATGRVPREQRRRPGAPVAAPAPRPAADGRAQIAAMLGKPGPAIPSPEPLARMIADGKAHSVARVRRLADKADETLAELRRALAHEAGREQIRRRLAELDAERDELRAKLASKPAAKPSTAGSGKPIEHGGWGGWQKHKARGETPCDDCERGKDEHFAGLRARKAAKAAGDAS